MTKLQKTAALCAIMLAAGLAGCGKTIVQENTDDTAAATTTTTTVAETTAPVETAAAETTTAATEAPEAETTEAAEEQADPNMMTVEDCVRTLIGRYTDAEIIECQYNERDGILLSFLTADELKFILLEDGSGISLIYERGELTDINNYQFEQLVATTEGFIYPIHYVPAE